MYNLEQLRMFVFAADAGSFSASARKLGKAQSAVSQGIANLEIDLNCQLFDRSTRKPGLTESGERLLPFAQAVLLQATELDSAATAIDTAEENTICLAVESAMLMPRLYAILREFEACFPGIELTLLTAESRAIQPMVKSGEADLGLMFADLTFNREVELGYIGLVRLIAVAGPDHPLARLEHISSRDLALHRQVIVTGDKNEFDTISPPLSPRLWQAGNFQILRDMIRCGSGWGYLPAHLCEADLKTGLLVNLNPSFDHKDWSQQVDLIYSRGRNLGPGCRWLHDQLKDLLDQH